MAPTLKSVWLLYAIDRYGELDPIQAHKSEESAKEAQVMLADEAECEIIEVPLESDAAAKVKSQDTKEKT